MDNVASIISALTGNWGVLVLILLVLVIVSYGVRKGVISFKGKGLEIAAKSSERTVMQRQTTFVHAQLDAIANKLNLEHTDFDDYKTKWICKCAELEWIRSIHYNHIEDTEGYRKDRFVALLALVQKKADNPYFFSEDFEKFLRKHVETVVSTLVSIRKEV